MVIILLYVQLKLQKDKNYEKKNVWNILSNENY